MRFKQRFFEKDGKPCESGTLCGGGHDLSVNSGLLLHLATDELSWALGAADLADRRQRWFWSLLVPAVLVPVIVGLLALVLMLLIQSVATVISRVSSQFLNSDHECRSETRGIRQRYGRRDCHWRDRPADLDRQVAATPAGRLWRIL